MVGRRRHRGAVPRDLGFQLRARRRSGARSHAARRSPTRCLPALAEVGTDMFHVAVLPPGGDHGSAGGALHARPHVVLGPGDGPDGGPQRPPGRRAASSRWSPETSCGRACEDSLALFGNDRDGLRAAPEIEQETFAGGHKRWLGRPRRRRRDRRARRAGAPGGRRLPGQRRHVPRTREAGDWRRRSCPGRSTLARGSGAGHVSLFADPDDAAVVRMYERLGFREAGRLASTKGPGRGHRLPREER